MECLHRGRGPRQQFPPSPSPGPGSRRQPVRRGEGGGELSGGARARGRRGAAFCPRPLHFRDGGAPRGAGRLHVRAGGTRHTHTLAHAHAPHTRTHSHSRTHAPRRRRGEVGGARRGGGGARSCNSQWCAREGAWPPRQWPPPSLLPPRAHTLSHSPPPAPAARRALPAGGIRSARALLSPPSPPPPSFPSGSRPLAPWKAIPVKGRQNWESVCGGSSCYIPSTRRRAALNGGGTPPGADWPRGADRHGRTAHGAGGRG